mgnify:CR=1
NNIFNEIIRIINNLLKKIKKIDTNIIFINPSNIEIINLDYYSKIDLNTIDNIDNVYFSYIKNKLNKYYFVNY